MSTTWHLSEREEQIVRLACMGLTDKEICSRISLCLTTVRTHWERIRLRLGASNRAQVIAMVTARFTEEVARGWYERARAMQEALATQDAIVFEVCERTLEVAMQTPPAAWLGTQPTNLRALLDETGLHQFVKVMREQRTAVATVCFNHAILTKKGFVPARTALRRVGDEAGKPARFLAVTFEAREAALSNERRSISAPAKAASSAALI